jgi:hypothetical protein
VTSVASAHQALTTFTGISRSNMDFRWYGQDALNAIIVENFVLNYIEAGVFHYLVDPIFGCNSRLSCGIKGVRNIYEIVSH